MEFGFDVKLVCMILEFEFIIENSWIYGGCFFLSGGILLVDYLNFWFIYLDCVGKLIF